MSENGYTKDEQQLVEACQRGERKAQKQLYETYARSMMPICIRYTNDYESAKDLLHDGFVKVFSHLSDYKGEGSFDGWMRRIFVNTALEQLRKLTERPNMVDVDDAKSLTDTNVSVVDSLTEEEIMQCISRLPDIYRVTFNMYAIDGYSHREIAEKLNVTESSSRVYLLRARLLLQEMLKKYDIGND